MWDLIILTIVIFQGESNGTPLQYSCLENPMDGGAWWAAVHGVAKSWTWLSDFTFTFHFHALEKELATHSSVLAWRSPGTGEPGGLQSMGSHRVGHDWSDLAAAAAVIFQCLKINILISNLSILYLNIFFNKDVLKQRWMKVVRRIILSIKNDNVHVIYLCYNHKP